MQTQTAPMARAIAKPPTSKRDRYGWITQDQPGVFMMVPKTELSVDARYQRTETISAPKILRVAGEWSWLACGCLIVGMHNDRLHVVDGQHRLLAAMKRDDITDLPCLVFEVTDARAEALGFLRANVNRKPMTMREKFKALSFTGDEIAAKTEALVNSAGRKIGKHADHTTVACVAAVMRCLQEDEGATRRVWPVVVALSHGRVINGAMLAALHYIERYAADEASLSRQPWRGRVEKAGYDACLAAMTKARAFHSKAGPRIDATGIINLMNARVRAQPMTITVGEG